MTDFLNMIFDAADEIEQLEGEYTEDEIVELVMQELEE